MRIAIISAGQRLRRTYRPDPRFAAVIAVNSAAAIFPCDYWSCGDAQTFAGTLPVDHETRMPILSTLTDEDANFRLTREIKNRFDRTPQRLTWGPMQTRTKAPGECTNWSITAALMLAIDLGAQVVEVFAHYYEGEDPRIISDCANRELPKRIETRPRVIADWKVATAWARHQGAYVYEHVPTASLSPVAPRMEGVVA